MSSPLAWARALVAALPTGEERGVSHCGTPFLYAVR
jgi:hypothetical protein